MISVYLTLTKL